MSGNIPQMILNEDFETEHVGALIWAMAPPTVS